MNAYIDRTATATFTVKGHELDNAVTLTLNDESGFFSIDANSVPVSDQESGKVITVTYSPLAAGNHTATITLSSPGVDNKTVTISGTAIMETYVPRMLPANEAYIQLTEFRADWTDETPAHNVDSYTLEVSTRPAVELLGSLDGSMYPGSYESITLTDPWSGKDVKVGYGSYYFNNYSGDGYISFTVPEGYHNDIFTMQITSVSGYYGSGNITVGSNQTAAVAHEFTNGETFNWLVIASAGEKITITSTDEYFSPEMSMVKVYSGDVNELNTLNAVNEDGDADYRLITGITNKFYTVKNLTEAGTFYFKVRAVYSDGTESHWSNFQRVTLSEGGHPYQPGDVDHDGILTIADVTYLIDALLSGGDVCEICADVDGDGNVTISDVTFMIDMLLTSN